MMPRVQIALIGAVVLLTLTLVVSGIFLFPALTARDRFNADFGCSDSISQHVLSRRGATCDVDAAKITATWIRQTGRAAFEHYVGFALLSGDSGSVALVSIDDWRTLAAGQRIEVVSFEGRYAWVWVDGRLLETQDNPRRRVFKILLASGIALGTELVVVITVLVLLIIRGGRGA